MGTIKKGKNNINEEKEEEKQKTDNTSIEDKTLNLDKLSPKDEDKKHEQQPITLTEAKANDVDVSYESTSAVTAKTAVIKEASLNLKSHLGILNQEVADRTLDRLISDISANTSGYLVSFGITTLADSEITPYYDIRSYSSSDSKLPTLFITKTEVNNYYNMDYTIAEQERNRDIFSTHPVLASSAEAYPVNAFKIAIDWDGSQFSSNISDPREIGDESLIKNISYIGTHVSDRYRDQKAFSRFKTFLEIIASSNVILVGLKRKQLSITIRNTKMSNKLNMKHVMLNDHPHLFYNGIYHSVEPFCEKINELLQDGDQDNEHDFNKFFKCGRDVLTQISALDIICKAYVNVDQFSAYILNNSIERLLNNRMTLNVYKTLLVANFPVGTSLEFLDSHQNEFFFMYKPTKNDWSFCLFMIMIDIEMKRKIIKFTEDIMNQRNLFSMAEVLRSASHLLKSKVQDPNINGAIEYLSKVLGNSTVEHATKLLVAEMHARHIDMNLRSFEITFGDFDILRFFELMIGFIIAPRLCWWNSHQTGRMFYDLLYEYCFTELGAWIAEYGLFVKERNGAFLPVMMNLEDYSQIDLQDKVYYSFLVFRNFSNAQLKKYPNITSIYGLIKPMGETINLNQKLGAGYPFLTVDYTAYVPWSILDYKTITTLCSINLRLDEISQFVYKLASKYMSGKSSKAKSLLLNTITIFRNLVKRLGLVLHATAAPLFRTLFNSFLFVCDGFNPTSPWCVPDLIGYAGYNIFNSRPARQANNNDLLGKGILTTKVRFECDTKLFLCIALSLQGVNKTDCVTATGAVASSNLYDPKTVLIGPIDGQAITNFALKLVGQTKRINSAFGIYGLVHNQSVEPPLQVLRDRLKSYWSSANAAHILSVISERFDCPIDRYFKLENYSETLFTDPKSFHPTLYSINYNGDIDPQQNIADGFNTRYAYGDDYDKNIWKVCSHILFNDNTPIFRQTEGIACGKFPKTTSNPTEFYDYANMLTFTKIDLDEVKTCFKIEGEIGSHVVFTTKLNDVDTEFTNPYDSAIPKIMFLIDKIANYPRVYLEFIRAMIESEKHVIVIRKLVIDYSITTVGSYLELPKFFPLFESLIEHVDSETARLTFFDTRFVEEHDFKAHIPGYFVMSYQNILPLSDFVVVGGIFANPNQAKIKLIDIKRDNYCFGTEDGMTSRFLISNASKIEGNTINFNNHVKYLTANAQLRAPELQITYSSRI
nr:P2 [Oat sterile dwarf virus]